MSARHLDDLAAFVAVATEQSFTKAAARLGVSQSALSQTVRGLEDRLQLRLLSRTTRRVAPTELGQRLLDTLSPRFDEIDREIRALRGQQSAASGLIRVTTSEYAAQTYLWPAVDGLMRDHPAIRFEITADAALTDIVGERFDAGIRLGEQVERDMIAVPIGPEERMAVVAAPSYLANHPVPREPRDVTEHRCLAIRMPTSKAILPWEFRKDGREINVRVDSAWILNSGVLLMEAALAGHGLAYMLDGRAAPHVREGRLVRVLSDWCKPFPGFHLYYPSRRQHTHAFSLFIDRLRYQG